MIAVIGDQSSGKSSILSQVLEIPFPVNAGICTCCPIVAHTRHDASLLQSMYEVGDGGEDMAEVTRDNLCARTQKIQRQRLETSGGCPVSEDPITIRVSGNAHSNLVLVDLPGIIHNGPGKKEVEKMIRTYISKPQCLILLVSEAKQDDELVHAIGLARTHDPREERTLRVLSKCDVFDSPDSKKRAIELVTQPTESQLSAHAVACRVSGDDDYDEEGEQVALYDFSRDDDSSRMGIPRLRQRLCKLLCDLVLSNLPGLRRQIMDKIAEHRGRLEIIGQSAPDPSSILSTLEKKFKRVSKQLKYDMTPHSRECREKIHKTKSIIDPEWVNDFYQHDDFETPFFQGQVTFDCCMDKICDTWSVSLHDYMNEIDELLQDLIDPGEDVSPALAMKVIASWDDKRREIMTSIRLCAKNALDKERRHKTVNHYLTSKYQEQLILPEEVLDNMQHAIHTELKRQQAVVMVKGTDVYHTAILNSADKLRDSLCKIIKQKSDEYAHAFNQKSLEDQNKCRVLAAVLANWNVSHKNILETVVGDIIKEVLDEKNNWIKHLIVSPDLRNVAGEHPSIVQERQRCNEGIVTLAECQTLLANCSDRDDGTVKNE